MFDTMSLLQLPPPVKTVAQAKPASEPEPFHTYPYPIDPWNDLVQGKSYGAARWNYFRRKYQRERWLGCALLVLALPIILVLSWLVRLHSRGGGFYRQTRVGYRGKHFEILKLRTMHIDAEADGKARWCVKGDPRITSLGRFLRKTHLDELPQLINVARGEMTLVGPRPERPCFVEQLKKEIDGYERRLSVLPGITGLSQINLPPDETIADVRRKQYLDLLYIDETDVWLDLRMLFATLLRMGGIPGEIVIRLLGLRRELPAVLDRQSILPLPATTKELPADGGRPEQLPNANVVCLGKLRYSIPPKVKALPSFVPNAFTVDVEDYFHVSGFAERVAPRDWDSFPCRVEANTRRLLELLGEKKVRGTFFILGWVADRYPQLIREIHGAGHELGCHSYWHRLIYQMTPEEFRDDLIQARDAIEQATGVVVQSYRAPSFSITQASRWAIDILAEHGFQLDSSIFPMKHDRYGIPDSTSAIHRHAGLQHTICEYPPTVWRTGPLRLPVGGGYFRLAPRWLTQAAIDGVRRTGVPAMFYIHPWEIDPQQPRIAGIRPLSRYRHFVGLHRTYSKLQWIIDRNPFAAIGDVMRHFDVASASPTESSYSEVANASLAECWS
jgi:polysaccharide deacetylase family protein (PEP-CTERM system associated)